MTIARGFTRASDLAAYHSDPRAGHRYGRDSSPEVAEAERAVETFHPGYGAVLFSSGMASIAALFDVARAAGYGIALPAECYRKVVPLAEGKWGAVHAWETAADLEGIKGKTLVWAESPCNPHLKLADYDAMAALRNWLPDMLFAVDLTFAGLGNFRPCDDFPDIIVHSLTKYACGHNDFMAGVVLHRSEAGTQAMWDHRSRAGGIPDPFTARMLTRSLKTADLRMERQVENAGKVIDYLRRKAEEVFYPEASPWHDHGAAVVSFRVAGGDPVELTDKIGAMKTITMAPSFGAVDSMAEVPSTMSRAPVVEPDLVRLSVGIEPVERIIADLETLF